MADEFDLAAFLETVGTGLQDLARSSAVQGAVRYDIPRAQVKDRGVVIDKDDTLVISIEDPRLDVELPRLRNVLANSSKHAGIIYEFVRNVVIQDREFTRQHKLALRLSVTMRDSLLQMSRLLNGESLDEPAHGSVYLEALENASIRSQVLTDKPLPPNHPASGNLTDEEMEESGYDGPMLSGKETHKVAEAEEEMTGNSFLTQSTDPTAIKMARVYERLKQWRNRAHDNEMIQAELNSIMNIITTRKS